MGTRQLDRSEWTTYFDDVSKRMAHDHYPTYAEIRVLDPEIGAQAEVEWVPLSGISYDRKDNLLEIATENIDHLIFRPDAIMVREVTSGFPESFEVVQGETKQIVELR